MTIIELTDQFSTEDKCLEYLKRLRWPNGASCPRDGSQLVSWIRTQKKFQCRECKYQFSIKAGTIFHDSHLTLEQWFLATFLMCESTKGVSANQIKRVLGISYKTAWYLCHRIRAAMKDADTRMLDGTIEVDETYVGGKRRHVGRGNRDNKTLVLAAIQRGGQVRFKIERRADKKTLHAFIKGRTAKDAKAIYTDDWAGYGGIGTEDTPHETVNHSAEEWVRGDVHTNSVEGVFSLLKRSVIGAYHHVSVKHLPAYLDELEFRFNRRKSEVLFADTIRHLVTAEALTFCRLTTNTSSGASA